MNPMERLFPERGALIGMIHLGALPGTPFAAESLDEVLARAAEEAAQLAAIGFDGLIVENMGDRPYLCQRVGPEVVATMTAACLAVRAAAPDLPLGVQVLAGANREALAVAQAAGAQFVRVEGFVFSSVADEGLMAEAAAGPLLRYRRSIGAEGVAIVADIKKKHSSHAITSDLTLAETARSAEFSGADAVIVTGTHTGEPTSPADLLEATDATALPVLVGSGVTPGQVPKLSRNATALIVGSYLKQDGQWQNPLDPARCEELVRAKR